MKRVRLWLSYVGYAYRNRALGLRAAWPGRLQRLWMQGDPTGEVRELTRRIILELSLKDAEHGDDTS